MISSNSPRIPGIFAVLRHESPEYEIGATSSKTKPFQLFIEISGL